MAETLHAIMAQPGRSRRRWPVALIAGALALSVALASAAPARADGDRDLVKALAALAVLGVIAHQVGKDQDAKAAKPVEHRPQPVPDAWRDDWPYRTPPHPAPARIPLACAIQIEGRGTPDVTVYTESCLRDYGVAARLPGYCARTIHFYGQRDRVYPAACLAEAGFRFEAARPPRPHTPSTPWRSDHERPD